MKETPCIDIPVRGRNGWIIKSIYWLSLLVSGLLASSPGRADTYSDILSPNDVVTGVRGLDANDVVLSGTRQGGSGGATQAFLYEGPLAGGGTTYLFTPTFSGEASTGSTFYGPDTPLFNPSIGVGNIRAVGSYQMAATGIQDHGLLYEGSINGSGTWTNIDVPSSVAGGTVGETIAHSTMGNLVVGDYDLAGVANSANAFIYNLSTKQFLAMNLGGVVNDTTAYGVWQNGINSNSYTIAGGTQHGDAVNKAYLVNYDADTGVFSDLTYYSYDTAPGSVTHFEGITGTTDGYNLIATTDAGAAIGSVTLNKDGTYGDITWTTLVDVPGSSTTTGNSIYQDTGMGIYQTETGVQSYIVTTVPEPSTNVLLLFSFLGLGFLYLRRRFV